MSWIEQIEEQQKVSLPIIALQEAQMSLRGDMTSHNFQNTVEQAIIAAARFPENHDSIPQLQEELSKLKPV
jgi:hypothetical protein